MDLTKLLRAAVLVSLISTAANGRASSSPQSSLARAKRSEKNGWTFLHIEGAPRELGFQHGYLLASEIKESIRTTRVSWEYQSGMDWNWLAKRAGETFSSKIDSECSAEIDGMVEGLHAAAVSLTRNDLLAYNGYFELAWYWWPGELKKIKDEPAPRVPQSCSSFIATGSLTRDGNIVLGHNSMMGYEALLPNVIADIKPDHGHRILWQTFPGWIHSGTDFFITDAGLVGSETTIGGFEGYETNGVPEFVRMRRATQGAKTIDEWCALMKSGNNGGYANAWLLGDINTKEIARLELGLKYIGFEKKKDGYFTGSNVAENMKLLRLETSGGETDIRSSSVARRVRWKELMNENAGKIDSKLARQFEGDHFDSYLKKMQPGGRCLCGHFELDEEPAGAWPGVPFSPTGTLDGKVTDAKMAREMSLMARWGSACGRGFEAPKFLANHPQFDWMSGILKSRPPEPWTEFRAE
jgi:hypothetical protein